MCCVYLEPISKKNKTILSPLPHTKAGAAPLPSKCRGPESGLGPKIALTSLFFSYLFFTLQRVYMHLNAKPGADCGISRMMNYQILCPDALFFFFSEACPPGGLSDALFSSPVLNDVGPAGPVPGPGGEAGNVGGEGGGGGGEEGRRLRILGVSILN